MSLMTPRKGSLLGTLNIVGSAERVAAAAGSPAPSGPPSPFSGALSFDLKTVQRLEIGRLAAELERIGIPVPPGVSHEAMKAAMTAHIKRERRQPTVGEIFSEFDADSSGTLDRGEISLVCASLGELRGAEGVEEVFVEIDVDGDGTISKEEFEGWWSAEIAPSTNTSTLIFAFLGLAVVVHRLV